MRTNPGFDQLADAALWALGARLGEEVAGQVFARNPAENMQTIIVKKTPMVWTLEQARCKAARYGAEKLDKVEETGRSWRFRQRPPTQFKKTSFRTAVLPGAVSIVYGALKKTKRRKSNPEVMTTVDAGHDHMAFVDEAGDGLTSFDAGHIHEVRGGLALPAGQDGHTHRLLGSRPNPAIKPPKGLVGWTGRQAESYKVFSSPDGRYRLQDTRRPGRARYQVLELDPATGSWLEHKESSSQAAAISYIQRITAPSGSRPPLPGKWTEDYLGRFVQIRLAKGDPTEARLIRLTKGTYKHPAAPLFSVYDHSKVQRDQWSKPRKLRKHEEVILLMLPDEVQRLLQDSGTPPEPEPRKKTKAELARDDPPGPASPLAVPKTWMDPSATLPGRAAEVRSKHLERLPGGRLQAVSAAWQAFGAARRAVLWMLLGWSKSHAPAVKRSIRATSVRRCPQSGMHYLIIAADMTAAMDEKAKKVAKHPPLPPPGIGAMKAYEIPIPDWDGVSSALLDESRWDELEPREETKAERAQVKAQQKTDKRPKWAKGPRTPKNDSAAKSARTRANKAIKEVKGKLKRTKQEKARKKHEAALERARGVLEFYNDYLDPEKTSVDWDAFEQAEKGRRMTAARGSSYSPRLPSGSRPTVARGSDRFVVSQIAQALALGVLTRPGAEKMRAPEAPLPPTPGAKEPHRYDCPRTKKNPCPEKTPAWIKNQCLGLLYDSEGRSYHYEVDVIPLAELETSHDDGFRENPNFPQEFQARDRSSIEAQVNVTELAKDLDPERLAQVGPSATEGSPVVASLPLKNGRRGFVTLAGNGRVMALRLAPEEMRACYFDLVLELAGRRGVLVRRLARLTVPQAVAFAAASQRSASSAESPMEQARALMRSIALKVYRDLPQVDARPLAGKPLGEDMGRLNRFEARNPRLRQVAFPQGEPPEWRTRAERYALIFLALLPEQAKQTIEAMGTAGESLFVGLSPYLAEVATRENAGELATQSGSVAFLNPVPRLARVAPLMSRYHGWTSSRIFTDIVNQAETPQLPGFEQQDMLAGVTAPDLGWLLGLLRVAAAQDPEKRGGEVGYRLVKLVDAEINEAAQSMFGYQPDEMAHVRKVFAASSKASARVAKEAEELGSILERVYLGRARAGISTRSNPWLLYSNPTHSRSGGLPILTNPNIDELRRRVASDPDDESARRSLFLEEMRAGVIPKDMARALELENQELEKLGVGIYLSVEFSGGNWRVWAPGHEARAVDDFDQAGSFRDYSTDLITEVEESIRVDLLNKGLDLLFVESSSAGPIRGRHFRTISFGKDKDGSEYFDYIGDYVSLVDALSFLESYRRVGNPRACPPGSSSAPVPRGTRALKPLKLGCPVKRSNPEGLPDDAIPLEEIDDRIKNTAAYKAALEAFTRRYGPPSHAIPAEIPPGASPVLAAVGEMAPFGYIAENTHWTHDPGDRGIGKKTTRPQILTWDEVHQHPVIAFPDGSEMEFTDRGIVG